MLQELVDESTDHGPLRRMLPACRVGNRINGIRDSMHAKEGESIDSFHNRLQRKVKLLSSQERCSEYESCAVCPRAHDIFAQQAAQERFCLPEHAHSVFEQMGRTGPDRLLPNTCSIGRLMNDLIGNDDVDGRRGEAVAMLGEQYGCATMTTCMHCSLGKGVVDVLLSDLAENGMRGDAGDAIRDTYSRLM